MGQSSTTQSTTQSTTVSTRYWQPTMEQSTATLLSTATADVSAAAKETRKMAVVRWWRLPGARSGNLRCAGNSRQICGDSDTRQSLQCCRNSAKCCQIECDP